MRRGQVVAALEHLDSLSVQIKNSLSDLCQVGQPMITSRRIQTRLSALNDDWNEFSRSHRTLLVDLARLNEDESFELRTNSYFCNDVFKATRDSFLISVETMNTMLDDIQPPRSTSGSTTSGVSALPTFLNSHRPQNWIYPNLAVTILSG